MTKLTLQLSGLHCSSCALSIDWELEELPGVKSVSTNFAASRTILEYDEEKVAPDRIIAAISKLGYTATLSQ